MHRKRERDGARAAVVKSVKTRRRCDEEREEEHRNWEEAKERRKGKMKSESKGERGLGCPAGADPTPAEEEKKGEEERKTTRERRGASRIVAGLKKQSEWKRA